MTTLYTLGYEGTSLENVVATLREARVGQVLDVRELPLSRRPGFSKTPLSSALALNGLTYRHLKALGTPRVLRDALKKGRDFAGFAAAYRHLLETRGAALEEAARLASETPSALLCFEADPAVCHRILVAEALLERGLVREVVHLHPS